MKVEYLKHLKHLNSEEIYTILDNVSDMDVHDMRKMEMCSTHKQYCYSEQLNNIIGLKMLTIYAKVDICIFKWYYIEVDKRVSHVKLEDITGLIGFFILLSFFSNFSQHGMPCS